MLEAKDKDAPEPSCSPDAASNQRDIGDAAFHGALWQREGSRDCFISYDGERK